MNSKQIYQSPDLRPRAAWAGGFVVVLIVGFSLFTPTFERRVGLWVIAVIVIIYFWLMASSRVEVEGSDLTVINFGRRRKVSREDIVECGMDTRPLIGPVGRFRLRDGSSVYLYGLQPRREAGDDTLRSDELAALALSVGSGGPLSPS
jgi:hypothetical protein